MAVDKERRNRGGRPRGTGMYPWQEWHATLAGGGVVEVRKGRGYPHTTNPMSLVAYITVQMNIRGLPQLTFTVSPTGTITARLRGEG